MRSRRPAIHAVLGDEQPGGDVEGHAGTGEQDQRRDDDPNERDVRVQVAYHTPGHAGQHLVVAGPAQLAGLGWSVTGADLASAVVVFMLQGCCRRWPPTVGISPASPPGVRPPRIPVAPMPPGMPALPM